MRAIRNFNEFIKEGIVKKQKSDKSRAKYLIKEAERSYKLLLIKIEKLGIDDQTANDIVKSCYDILMEIIRAKMFLEGLNASGQGAHEAEVSYLRLLGFNEKNVQFMDQIRYFRNGMLYYGTMLNKEDAERIIEFTKKIYSTLKERIKGDKNA